MIAHYFRGVVTGAGLMGAVFALGVSFRFVELGNTATAAVFLGVSIANLCTGLYPLRIQWQAHRRAQEHDFTERTLAAVREAHQRRMHNGRSLSLSPGRRAGGFTLVEALVVAAIASILLAMMLVGIDASRRRARLLVCASNQRQCAVMVQSYAYEQHALPFGNENAGGDLFYSDARGGSTIDQVHLVTTCPALARADPDAHWSYYAGRMLTDFQRPWAWGDNGGSDPIPELLWPVTRHYEEIPREWLWCEPIGVHEGKRTSTRFDGSGAVDAVRHIDDAPMEHP